MGYGRVRMLTKLIKYYWKIKTIEMKRIYIIFLFLLHVNFIYSQSGPTKTIEKSLWGIQTGFPGIWGHNESKIGDQFALRTEVGLDAGMWGGNFYRNTGFLLIPVISIEPRFYYNNNKRADQQKNVKKNSGNFITLKNSYHPDWFIISNHKNIKIIQDLSITPTWGMRRLIGNSNFAYEVGGGIGYRYIFAKQAGYPKNEGKVAVNLHLRIGYTF